MRQPKQQRVPVAKKQLYQDVQDLVIALSKEKLQALVCLRRLQVMVKTSVSFPLLVSQLYAASLGMMVS